MTPVKSSKTDELGLSVVIERLRHPAGAILALVCSGILLVAAHAPGETGGKAAEKSVYNLFHPTPEALLRELSTDRPDKTESPYTVDAGHFQLEMDLLSYTHDGEEENFALTPANFKAGLFNNVDLQVIAETYNIQRTRSRGARARQTISGFGDLLVRLKVNLWGNDGGDTAFGVMPFVKFPTNQHELGNSAVEGGTIFPFAIQLPRDFNLGAMTEVDFVRNGENYDAEFINSITVGRAIVGALSGYAEFFSAVSTAKDAPWMGTFDFGVTYQIGPNIQLDAGMNVGLTRSAEDLNPFVGISARY